MKKMISVILILMLAMAITACSTTAAAPAQTEATEGVKDKLQMVKESGKLVLGTAADYPPFEFHVEIDGKDTIVGFDIDIAKKIAESMGVELEIIDMKFEGLLPALTAGKIDLIVSGMTPTDERKESVDFSIVYYDAKQTMLVKTEDVDVLNTIEAFSGMKLGVQKASIQEELANTLFLESEVKAIDKIPNLILELKTDKVDGLLLAEPVAVQYAKANDDLSVNGVDLGSEGGSAIAVQKNSGAYLEVINETIQALIDSGEINKFITEATLLSEGE